MPTAPQITLSDAQLQDKAVAGINAKLAERLAWLTTAYGIAVKKPNEKGYFPAFETDSNDSKNYESLFPNEDLGVFSFWDVKDGATITRRGQFVDLKFKAGLVFWGDLRKVYGVDWKTNNTQNVVSEVAAALQGGGFMANLKFTEYYTEARNIYQGYYMPEFNGQQLMRPYFGFRIECEIYSQQKCNG